MTVDLHIRFDEKSPEGLALETLTNLAAQAADPDNFDYLFTPQKIAEIRAAEAEAETGESLTIEQVREHFKAKYQAWQQNHPA